jgi:hypothetical protein
MGKVLETKTHIAEFFFGNNGFVFGNKVFENTAVAAQNIIDIPHQVIGIAVALVVIIVAAIIGAEFFVCPAYHWLTAIDTGLLHKDK